MPLACMPKCPLSQHSQQQCYQKSVARCKLLWETRKVGKEKVCKKVWKAEYKLMMGLKAIRMLLIGSQKYKNPKETHKVHFHSLLLLKLKFSMP